MVKKEFIIGILGGMGTYATIHLFEQYAELFKAEKEWDRPRIIIDNNCTMPSRVRAVLYEENTDLLITKMSDSIRNLIYAGASRIILGCNTSHIFLDGIYEIIPEAKQYIVNIIDVCVAELAKEGVKNVYLLATEGTILSNVYNNKLKEVGIKCETPKEQEFVKLRSCIEAVKQNSYSTDIKDIFMELVLRRDFCVLGCTELPILYQRYQDSLGNNNVYDPLYIALCKVKKEYQLLKK
jgi:aspartate racemase